MEFLGPVAKNGDKAMCRSVDVFLKQEQVG
jgi:hypothetical protein